MASEKSVLFVCLGNICRSPMAESIFRHLVQEKGIDGWKIDSAAIGPWHVGKKADKRCHSTLKKHGMSSDHTVRQTKTSDFKDFKYIFGFDDANISFMYEYFNDTPLKPIHDVLIAVNWINRAIPTHSDLESQKPSGSDSVIELLGKYDPQNELIIEDPYYTTDAEAKAFETVYQQCHRCLTAFLDSHK